MNARDLSAEAVTAEQFESTPQGITTAILDDLRAAANATEGDTITIGPDGTVGRLVQAVGSTGGAETLLWLIEWEEPLWRTVAHIEPATVPSVPLYRVVAP